MISIFALGSDLPEIEVIRSALSEERKPQFYQSVDGEIISRLCFNQLGTGQWITMII